MTSKNNSFQEIWDFLRSCKNIAMTLHQGPDGDSLGGCVAMKKVLEKEGIKVTLVSGDPLSENLENLPFSKEVNFTKDISDLAEENFDAFVYLDSGTAGKISAKFNSNYKLPGKTKIINIDHHDGNSFYGDLNYVDVNMSSVCTLLVDFFKEMNVKFDHDISLPLMVGMCTDNGFFNYPKVPQDDFEKATFLIDNGVDYTKEVALPILFNDSLKMKKLYGIILDNLEVDKEARIGWSTVSLQEIKKLGLNRAEIRLGVHVIQDLKEADVVFLLVDVGDYIKGSLRSKGRDISVVANKMNGGGHKLASGFKIESMPLDEAISLVLRELKK